MSASTLLTLGVAVIPATSAVAAAWFAYRSAGQANRVSADANRLAEKKLDAEAYDRSQRLYDAALAAAERAADQLRIELERVQAQLAREQQVSDRLRTRVTTLEEQVTTMESAIRELRRELDRERQRHSDSAGREDANS